MKFLKPKFLVFLIPFLLYFNTLWNGYSFDDNFVTNNETVKKGWSAIPEIFSGYYFQEEGNTFGYRPVVRSLYAIEYSVFGENPAVSHFFNILLYAILCLVIFRFLTKLFPTLQREYIFLIVLLFAVHPVHTEVVASLKNREEILAMLLGILSLSLYCDFLDKKNYLLLIPVPFLIFLAVLTKENSLTYPLLLPFTFFFKNEEKIVNKKKLIFSALFTLMVFLTAWSAFKLPGYILPSAEKELFAFENPLYAHNSILNRIYLSGISLWFYLKILFIPYPLRFYYGFNMFPIDTYNGVLSGTIIIVFMLFFMFAVYRIRSLKQISFFIFFFLISISVFTNFFIPVNGIVGERMVFQASLGFCGVIITALYYFSGLRKNKVRIHKRINTILYIVIALFMIMTFQRNRDWKDFETLLKADIGKLDNSAKGQVVYASWNLGQIMNRKAEGKYVHPDAINSILKHYIQSVEIFPEYYSSFNNIGTIFLHLKNRPDSAIKYFAKAISYKPEYPEALFNYGMCCMQMNLTDSAISYFNRAISVDKAYSEAWIKLSELHIKKGDTGLAVAEAENALKCDSVSDAPLINLGNICLLQKDTALAVMWWEKAIEKKPQNPKLLYGLSKYFLQTGEKTKSENYNALFLQFSK